MIQYFWNISIRYNNRLFALTQSSAYPDSPTINLVLSTHIGHLRVCENNIIGECMRKRFFHHSPLTTRVVNFTNITTLYLWMSSGKFTHHSQEEGALGAVKKTHHSSKIYHSEWWVVKKMSFFVFAHTLYFIFFTKELCRSSS